MHAMQNCSIIFCNALRKCGFRANEGYRERTRKVPKMWNWENWKNKFKTVCNGEYIMKIKIRATCTKNNSKSRNVKKKHFFRLFSSVKAQIPTKVHSIQRKYQVGPQKNCGKPGDCVNFNLLKKKQRPQSEFVHGRIFRGQGGSYTTTWQKFFFLMY